MYRGGVETGKGGGSSVGNCGGWASRGNYARHLRNCRGRVVSGGGFVGDRRECEIFCRMQSAMNLARHRARCRQVWDPGGGHRP